MPSRSRKSSFATASSADRPLPAPGRAVRGAGGFSLLEVLIALAILGIGVGVVFEGLGSGLRLRRESADNVRVAVAAERLLGDLTSRPLAPTKVEEGEDDGCRWRLEPLEKRLWKPAGEIARGTGLVEVRLTVTAPSGRSLELTTLLPSGADEAAP